MTKKKVNAKKYLKKLVSINQIEEVLSLLRTLIAEEDAEQEKILILRSSNYNQLLESIRKKTISRSGIQLQLAKIKSSLIDLINLIPDDTFIETERFQRPKVELVEFLLKYGRFVVITLSILLILGIILMSSIPKKNIDIRLTINSNYLKFKTVFPTKFHINKQFQALDLEEFNALEIPAQRVKIQKNLSGPYFEFETNDNRKLKISSKPNSHSKIFFEQIDIELLDFGKDIEISVTLPKEIGEDGSFIQLNSIPGKLKGNFYYQESLAFQAQHVKFSGLNDNLIIDDMEISDCLIPGQIGVAQKFSFESDEDFFSLYLVPRISEELVIGQQGQFFNGIDFVRIDEFKEMENESSIIEGKIEFMNQNRQSYENPVVIPSNYFLFLKNYEKLQLISMKISGKEIQSTFEGKIGSISLGSKIDEDLPQNPSLLRWELSNRLPRFILFLFIFLLISYLILKYPGRL